MQEVAPAVAVAGPVPELAGQIRALHRKFRQGRRTKPKELLGKPPSNGGVLLGLGDAGVAFDGVQRQLQAAGAFEQADALVEEVVDLLPALPGGLLAGTGLGGRSRRGL